MYNPRPPMFSARTLWNLTPNALSAHLAARRASGRPFDDLTESNPTRVGLGLAHGPAWAALAAPAVARYEPDPRGLPVAREAVCAYYAARGHALTPDDLVLTASTSEAYAWLFKLLCDAGDEVLVAHPSYPLFDDLAKLEGVALRSVPLADEGRWELDVDALDAAVTDRTRAVLIVHPNNPTGSLVSREGREALVAMCARRSLALVVDEVFGDYAWRDDRTRSGSFCDEDRALTFTLSGLSKVLAMPQLKLGWMVVRGPKPLRDEALARIEMIADSYLSVGAPVQHAAAALLAHRGAVQGAIRARVAANFTTLRGAIGAESCATLLPADAGWYAMLRVPRTRSDDAWVRALLDDDDVLVQPGWFFDVAREGVLVVSLLPEEPVFARAVARLVARVDAE